MYLWVVLQLGKWKVYLFSSFPSSFYIPFISSRPSIFLFFLDSQHFMRINVWVSSIHPLGYQEAVLTERVLKSQICRIFPKSGISTLCISEHSRNFGILQVIVYYVLFEVCDRWHHLSFPKSEYNQNMFLTTRQHWWKGSFFLGQSTQKYFSQDNICLYTFL